MKRWSSSWSRWPLLRAAARAGAALALCLPALPTAQALNLAPGARVTTPQVQAELLAHAPEGVGPGKPLQLGLRLTHQPGWHTYWKNPGDSGLPVTLQWTLPPGLSAGDIQWPTPQRIPIGDLANYGYEGRVLLPVPLRWAGGAATTAEALTLRLKASWLVCRRECIPEEGEFALQLPLGGTGTRHTAEFEEAARASPRPAAGASARGEATGQ
ncbi:MAG: hypothetical protein FGM55_04890, partial [Rhodoferax sp.]|nr:hypothetical protein [Rhodoferax sp.]